MTVDWVRDNETGDVYYTGSPDGTFGVDALSGPASGAGDRVRVNDVPGDWWEAHYTDPNPTVIPDGSTLLSVVVTVQYEMEDTAWNGTLTLEALATSIPKSLGTTDLLEQTVVTQDTWDITSLVNAEADPLATLNDLGIRMINDDPIVNVRVRWSYTKVDVQYEQPPDLNMPSFSATHSDRDVGDVISVNVTVQNSGDTPSGDFSVGLFYDRAGPPSVSDVPDMTKTVVSLGPGVSTPVSFNGISGTRLETWNMYVLADCYDDVFESNEANNAEGPVAVSWHGRDLVIPVIEPSLATPTAGVDPIDVVVTVRNLGDRDVTVAEPFSVTLFYDEAVAPAVGDSPPPLKGDTQTGFTLAQGGELLVTFPGIANTEPEAWQMWAIVDNAEGVTEVDETNNVGGPAAVAWQPLPDLVVSSIDTVDQITGSPVTEPAVDDMVRVEVRIANPGLENARDFSVGLYYNLPAPPGPADLPDRSEFVSGVVPAGDHRDLAFDNVTNGSAEVWSMYVVVDYAGVIEESSDSNNSLGPVPLNWGGVTDVVVISPNGGETWESQTTRQIRWAAYGSIPGTDVTIAYSTDGGGGWTDIVTAPKGDGVFDWAIPDIDSDLCLVRVTSEGGSYEDRSDGVFTILPAGVAKPNLRILSIVPSNPTPNGSDVIDVDVTVVNTGTVPAGLFFVDLFLDRSAAPSLGEAGDRSEFVTGLQEAGAPLSADEVTVSFLGVSSDWADHWSMYAVVDTHGYVDESSEQDNVAGPVDVSWRRFWVVWPNGGEILEPGKTYTVSWNSTLDAAEPVDIELSVSGGVTWATVVRGISNSGFYVWTVPALESDSCRLRIGDSAGTIADESNGFFALQVGLKGFYGSACGAPGAGPLADDPAMLQWLVLLVGLAFLRRLLFRRGLSGRS